MGKKLVNIISFLIIIVTIAMSLSCNFFKKKAEAAVDRVLDGLIEKSLVQEDSL